MPGQYKKNSAFSAIRGSGESESRIAALEAELTKTHKKLNDEFTRLERTSSGSQTIVIVNSPSSGGSGGSTSSSLLPRGNGMAIVTTGTTITFSEPFSGGFTLIPVVYKTVGTQRQFVGYNITNVTQFGFTITPDEDCTLEYAAIPHT